MFTAPTPAPTISILHSPAAWPQVSFFTADLLNEHFLLSHAILTPYLDREAYRVAGHGVAKSRT